MTRAVAVLLLVTLQLTACGEVTTGLPPVGTEITADERSYAVDGLDRLYLLSLGESELRVREVVGNEPQDRLTIPIDGVPRSAAGLVTSAGRAFEIVVDACPDGLKDPGSEEFPLECNSEPSVRRVRVAMEDWTVVREDDLTDLGKLAYPPAPTGLRLGRLGSEVFLDSGRNASVLLPDDGPPSALPAPGCPIGDVFYSPPSASGFVDSDFQARLEVYDASGRPASTLPLPEREGARLGSFQIDCSAQALFVIRRWINDDAYAGPSSDLIAFDGSEWTSPLVEEGLSFTRGPISASMVSISQVLPVEGRVDETEVRRLLVDTTGIVGTVAYFAEVSGNLAPVPLGSPSEETVVDPDPFENTFLIRNIDPPGAQ